MITHSSPSLSCDILSEIKDVLHTKMIAQGQVVELFEQQISKYIGGRSTICVGSGTAAIQLSLKALKVGIGDEVILPTLVCRNVLEAVLSNGSTPVLCDVGDNWVVTYDTVKQCVTRKTKVIIVPHLYGIKVDIQTINKIGIPIIEDCAQAFGRTIDNIRIGNEGDLAVFSFHATKCLTTGEGGAVMVNSNNKLLIRRLFQLRDGGNELSRRIFSPMSNISAAIGIVQLRKYDYFLKKRFELARLYNRFFKNKNDVQTLDNKKNSSMYFRYVVKTRRTFSSNAKKFEKEGIVVRRGVDLLLHHLIGKKAYEFKNADFLFNHTISLPIYPALKQKEIRCICRAINNVFV